jgi:hypothetical protein
MNYKAIDPNEKLPPKTTDGGPSDDWWSRSYFVMTDNGNAIAYYDFQKESWYIHHNDNATHVVYWLEKQEE